MDFFFSSRNNRYSNYSPHDHGYWEILISLEGYGQLVADDEKYDFRPGTIFCIRPGVTHAKSSLDGYVDGSILSRTFCFDRLPDKVFVFQDDEDQSFLTLYRLGQRYSEGWDSLDNDSPISRFQRSILEAIQNLLRHWRDEANMPPELAAFQKYLFANITETQLDMEEAIASTGYSPSHFRRIFRDHFGCSPVQYYNQIKIQLAKEELLRSRTLTSIAQIASICGFNDPDYFTRVFRQFEGMTPSQFYEESRKQLDKNRIEEKKEDLEISS